MRKVHLDDTLCLENCHIRSFEKIRATIFSILPDEI